MELAQRSQITVVIDGEPAGTWDTLSGSSTTAEPTKRRSGGMGPLKSYAALPDFEDLTVGKQWDLVNDWERARKWRRRVGRAVVSVNEQPLDENGAVWGKPKTHTGRLTGLDDGEADSDSTDARMLEITVQVTSVA